MSSLKDDASLIMIPSLYKDGRLDTVKPLGNSILHPDATGNHDGTDGSTPPEGNFTFSRGSNLAATRVDVNGLIEKGRENLLTYSNTFSDLDWEKSNVTITSGFEGYDGTNNAWELTRTAAAYARMNQAATQSGVYTHSIYAKAGTLNFISIGPSGGGEGTWFNLSDGTIGIEGGLIKHSSIESVGNGWYRISVVVNNPSNQWFRFYPSDVDGGDESATATGTIYVQDAQLEQGLVATDYIETGTSAAQSGILEDMPRLDYSGGASCPSLLLEPQRSNFVTYSEYFENYTKYDSSVTSNGAISPEGLKNATKLFDGTGSTQHYIGNVGIGYFTNTDIRGTSVFVKAGTLDYMQLRIGNITGDFSYYLINVNLNDGSVSLESSGGTTNHSNSVEDYGNGWYRVSMACSFTNSNVTGSRTEIYTAKNNSHTYTGTGTDYILIYGAQVEQGSYPTSYIPTYGSSVTRSYDTLNDLDLDGLFSGNSYTILFDIDLNDTFNNKVFAEAKKSTGGSSFTFRNFNGLLRVYNNLDSTYLTGSIASDSSKWVVRINGSTADVFSYNSGSPSKTSGTPLATIRDFGKINFSGGPTISSLNQFLIFPTALSDAECNSLVQ